MKRIIIAAAVSLTTAACTPAPPTAPPAAAPPVAPPAAPQPPAVPSAIQQHARDFCSSIVKINQEGVSAAPGTPAGEMIARMAAARGSDFDYGLIWEVAKSTSAGECQAIW